MELTTFQNAIVRAQYAQHERFYENLTNMIGASILCALQPASKQEIRAAIAAGDIALNTISRARWDAVDVKVRKYAFAAGIRNLSISQSVSLLKHVARNHYLTRSE